MQSVLAGLLTLDDHLSELEQNPNSYRPSNCPDCGSSGLWRHGVYYRKNQVTDLQKGSLCEKKTPVLRFRCNKCNHTCSVAPEYVSPRRWHSWIVQQAVFSLLLAGNSLRATRGALGGLMPIPPSICAIHQWWRNLRSSFLIHQFHVCDTHPEIRLQIGFENFWKAVLEKIPLSSAAIILHRNSQAVF
jgi:transposase-like protein